MCVLNVCDCVCVVWLMCVNVQVCVCFVCVYVRVYVVTHRSKSWHARSSNPQNSGPLNLDNMLACTCTHTHIVSHIHTHTRIRSVPMNLFIGSLAGCVASVFITPLTVGMYVCVCVRF